MLGGGSALTDLGHGLHEHVVDEAAQVVLHEDQHVAALLLTGREQCVTGPTHALCTAVAVLERQWRALTGAAVAVHFAAHPTVVLQHRQLILLYVTITVL